MNYDMSEERKAAKPVRSASHALICCLMAAGLAAAGATAVSAATLGPLTEVTPTISPFFGSNTCNNDPAGATVNCEDNSAICLNSYVEPWVDVHPAATLGNPDVMVVYTQTDRWSNGGSHGLLANVSTNGGTTWTPVAVPKTSECTGGTFDRASDPWVSFGPDGTLYQVSLSFDEVTPPKAPGGFGGSALLVSKSTNNGLTWTSPVTVIQDMNPRILNDKESITADPTRTGNVYVVWDRLEVPEGGIINPENVIGLGFKSPFFFSRSTDGGKSFSPPQLIFDPGANSQTIGNQLLVLPDGTLVDLFNEILNFNGSSRGFNLALLRSADQGTTWLPHGPPIVAAKILSIPVTTPVSGQPVRSGDILFDVAVNGSNGTLYAVWQDARFSNGAADAIAFSQSTDGGLTWSTPIKVNQTPTNISAARQQAFNASVAVNGSGTLLVTYYDFRNASGTVNLTDYFAVSCSTNCTEQTSWTSANEARLTSASFDITKAPVTGSGFFLGDYDGLKAESTGSFTAIFAQPVPSLTGATNPAAIFSRSVTP